MGYGRARCSDSLRCPAAPIVSDLLTADLVPGEIQHCQRTQHVKSSRNGTCGMDIFPHLDACSASIGTVNRIPRNDWRMDPTSNQEENEDDRQRNDSTSAVDKSAGLKEFREASRSKMLSSKL